MDERQAQIREGAGLDEARLNVEFIDFLKKWSTPVLVVVAVIAVGYFLYQKQREKKTADLGNAFSQLDEARATGHIASLIGIARDHQGQGAVPEIALLHAADINLAGYRARLKPGGRIDATGKPDDEAHVMTEEEAPQFLEQARQWYQAVVDDTSGKPDMAIHTVQGLFGLAAVAETAGKLDEARSALERLQTIAAAAKMTEHADLAKHRLETLGSLSTLPRIYAKSEIPVSVAGNVPEGMVPLGANPFGTAPQVPGPTPGPVGPEAPPVPEQPVTPVPVQEPETANPNSPSPAPAPVEPAPKPEDPKPADPPKEKPGN